MNDERNAKIVKLWNSGLSAKEVGIALGVTKNTVLAAVVKHRALGDITRFPVYSRGERSRLAIIARYGFKSKRQQVMKPITLHQHRTAPPETTKDPKQSRAHTIASVIGRGSANPQPVTLPKVNLMTLDEIEQKYKDI